MEKFKICPYCGEKNAPVFMECIECSSDLTGVRITDEEAERKKETVEVPVNKALVRKCECGAQNAPNARKCASCDEDISDILPIEATTVASSFLLTSVDGTFAYQIVEDDVTIGREGEMRQYLSEKSYVSRAHCRMFADGDGLYIENLSGTNPTFVNNIKINEPTRLNDGDEIGLGGLCRNGERQDDAAYFLVRIGTCI